MKITIYGAAICPDCVQAKAILEKREDIEMDYKDITESTKTLKEFLAYRDNDELFEDVIRQGKIGIPFFILEDGKKTFDIFDYLDIEKPMNVKNVCSIDGKGQC
ncbi:glutaredoxin domain-containing protein [Clostridium sp. 'White wine YQ']|uniref:glutaredoxin domain-containing protein n=1 Tax=Clostridium sp. 'White wine YQ' TaxID=3027474 RepID=UPI00236696F6|nr:glutaredoxin domain-containing protein [Clostridium sp. 'White wine YQ']MDD7794509.1 glutaredoxin domain-containing protein [Clostridium sp. 'White wine YQ']